MQIKNLLIGLFFIVSGPANAVSTVFMPTNTDVNFAASVNSGSTGLQLAMFDDLNTGFTGASFLQIALGNDRVTFSPLPLGQNIDYTVTNSAPGLVNSATLFGSDHFILAMRDTNEGLTWLEADAFVCNSVVNSCSISWTGLSTELIVDIRPVPVPAAVWLFGSGLLGMVGVARRKKAK